MQAIRRESFAIESLKAVQAFSGPVDLSMLERTAYALELLGRLVDAEVDLVFKGGTSLILRLQKIRRLSIDVDIICAWPRERLDPLLREIARKPPFLDFEEHVRRRDSLPARRHYKFFFKSVVDGNRLPILLDVLEEGITRMANYLIGCRFGRDEARIAASRAAFLCHLLRIGECAGPLQKRRFDLPRQAALAQIEIKWPQGALNKLLDTTPEAFSYWSEIFKNLPGRQPGAETPLRRSHDAEDINH